MPKCKTIPADNHDYDRHGTTTLFTALNIAISQVTAGHYNRHRRREFLNFMNSVSADCLEKEIDVILDTLSTYKPKHNRQLDRDENVHFYYTPTLASWLNQIETCFAFKLARPSGAPASSQRINSLVLLWRSSKTILTVLLLLSDKTSIKVVPQKEPYAKLRNYGLTWAFIWRHQMGKGVLDTPSLQTV